MILKPIEVKVMHGDTDIYLYGTFIAGDGHDPTKRGDAVFDVEQVVIGETDVTECFNHLFVKCVDKQGNATYNNIIEELVERNWDVIVERGMR